MHASKSDSLHKEIGIRLLGGVLAETAALEDKGLLIERDIGLEKIYALLSNGMKMTDLAKSLSLTRGQLKFILTRTSEHRKRYFEATVFRRGIKSGNTLDQKFSDVVELDKEQNNAAKYHASNVDTAMKSLQQQKFEAGTGVTVQNTIVVRAKDDIPALPDGLEDIIEGEFEDVDS